MTQRKNMSKKSIFLIIVLFLSILTVIRLGWLTYFQQSGSPIAEEGTVDLTDVTFNDSNTFALDGEWQFIANEYVDAPTFEQRIREGTTETIQVPGSWSEEIHAEGSDTPAGKGTYYLHVKLPKINRDVLGIYMKRIKTASNIYLDEERIMEYGELGADPNHRREQFGIDYALFHTDKKDFSLVFHVENVDSPTSGGLKESIHIGTETAISKEVNLPVTFQLIVAVILIVHALYSLSVYFMGGKNIGREFLYFALLLLSNGAILLIDEYSLFSLPVHYDTYQHIFIFLFGSSLLTLLLFIEHLFSIKTWINYISKFLFTIFLLLCVVGNKDILAYLAILGEPFYYFTISVLLFYIYKIIKHQKIDILLLLFLVAYSSNALWRMAVKLSWVDMPFYPIDFLISIIAVALILIRRHIRLSKINDEQTRELQRMDKTRDEFLANTSHELRNPLHGIINIADAVREQENKRLSPKGKRNLSLLSDIGKRMGYTLNDLSTVTQLKEDKIQIHPTVVDVHIVATIIVNLLQFMKEGKDIRLVSHIPSHFPKVWADENRIIQILFNLVHNAIKNTTSGSIQLKAEVRGKEAVIYVEDTGSGIESSKVEDIFSPYTQEHTNQAMDSGIGIGLSVSKQLVELHGGEITFQSNENGTTFMFTMPLDTIGQVNGKNPVQHNIEIAQEIEIPTVVAAENPAQNNNASTILIVDDDPVNLRVLTNLLHDDYHIITALDAQKALNTVPLQTIDIILSDTMMPNMSGYEFIREVRKKYAISKLPILLITAKNTPEDVQLAFQSGANDYLVKPVNAKELQARVQALVHLKHYIKESQKYEAAWLQAQIQPHFLFNTLNTIASLAAFDTEKMNTVLQAFGTYLQQSFSIINLESTIAIKHAIELTESYIMIEKARFGDRIHVEYDFDKDIDIMIPPLSIQPLIENAINHGILQKKEGGNIIWRIKDNALYTEITIQDDGVGMSQDKMDSALDVQPSPDEGIGVKNTHRRLVQLYNRGLQIESKIGEGTTISFQIPK